jgi:DNA-binding transcriptional MerR regulator/methylmalonyl-CoA mutase cobalamin-binding subunit
MKEQKRYPIGYVAARCGLTPHVIRAWERRYGAVEPFRTATNRRLYSDADIQRLQLLKEAAAAGNSIAQIAGLSNKELARTARISAAMLSGAADTQPAPESNPETFYNDCVAAVLNLDPRELDGVLSRAAIALPEISLLKDVIVPLADKIGELWAEGKLKIFGEHMAMAVIRLFLGDMLRSAEVAPEAPKIVVTTPAGQMHEYGALIVAAVAMIMGWQPVYLGPNLPAEEISAAAVQTSARIVAVSIVHPPDDPRVNRELLKMGRFIDVPLIVGGRAAASYEKTLKQIKAILINSIPDLSKTLTSFLTIQI